MKQYLIAKPCGWGNVWPTVGRTYDETNMLQLVPPDVLAVLVGRRNVVEVFANETATVTDDGVVEIERSE